MLRGGALGLACGGVGLSGSNGFGSVAVLRVNMVAPRGWVLCAVVGKGDPITAAWWNYVWLGRDGGGAWAFFPSRAAAS
jgi:hypothetical protein